MVTIKDIAFEAGVSIATVSNVINGVKSKVSEEKASKIYKIIKKRQYVPNSFARTLVAKSSNIIAGILLRDTSLNIFKDQYNAEFFGELLCAVQDYGYYMMFRYVNSCEEVIQNLRSWNVDGAVFLGTSDTYSKKIKDEIKIPLIFTDSYTMHPEITSVNIDDYGGGKLAAEYFLEKGHTKLGFVGYVIAEQEKSVVSERLNGFISVLKERNLKPGKDQLFYVPSINEDEQIQKIASRLASGKTGITALFISADKLAISLIEALSQHGVKVPEDISIIGFDDLPIAAINKPKLTTIRQNISEKARIATELLFCQINNKDMSLEMPVLNVTLVERDSVRFIKKKSNKT